MLRKKQNFRKLLRNIRKYNSAKNTGAAKKTGAAKNRKQPFFHRLIAEKFFSDRTNGKLRIPIETTPIVYFRTNIPDLETQREKFVNNGFQEEIIDNNEDEYNPKAFGDKLIDFLDYQNRYIGRNTRELLNHLKQPKEEYTEHTIHYNKIKIFSFQLHPKFHFEFLKQNIDILIKNCRFQYIPDKSHALQDATLKNANIQMFGTPEQKDVLWVEDLFKNKSAGTRQDAQNDLLRILTDNIVNPPQKIKPKIRFDHDPQRRLALYSRLLPSESDDKRKEYANLIEIPSYPDTRKNRISMGPPKGGDAQQSSTQKHGNIVPMGDPTNDGKDSRHGHSETKRND